MLGEQALFAAAAPRPVEEVEARQAEPQPEPKLNRAQRRRLARVGKARPVKPAKPAAPESGEESAAAFRARAARTFEATFATAPPHVREVLGRLSPEQRMALADRCWPEDEDGEQYPQGP